MADVVKKLSGWIERQLSLPDLLDKLVLRHVQADGKHGSEVGTWSVPADEKDGGTAADRNPDALADRIIETAEQDAGALGSVQRYLLSAWFAGEDRPSGRFAFRASGAEDEDEDADGSEALTEPPSMRGMLQQLMRHNEALMRSSVGQTMHVMEMQTRIIRSQDETVQKLVGEKMETISMVEELRTKKHERELAEQEQKVQLDMKRDIVDAVKMLLPAAVNGMTGKMLMPMSVSPEMVMLNAFFESLKAEQLQVILGTLDPAQQVVVMKILERRQAESDSREKDREKPS